VQYQPVATKAVNPKQVSKPAPLAGSALAPTAQKCKDECEAAGLVCKVSDVSAVHAAAKDMRLPVTLLSGFLGSGKTTLLTHILKNKAGLRCAVLVNDMGEINVDADLVRNGGLVQIEEDLVQLENGCICCTLRADLVVEVARLVRQNRFDYLVIESTGISEPQQVAETFTMPVPVELVQQQVSGAIDGADAVPAPESEAALSALSNLARLDTCVTVIDAANFDHAMASVVTVQEGEHVEPFHLNS
jgi:G3E family GTPase